ncbi:hypothetical protein [Streptomyces europaeiscabiei]|uniref:hypothetical protein n=1 Tax=Streptomyces europaeiscabiei TaxID=146819 RepID=UPI00131D6514|nr:hypothetical protein [Streptomyces europaeiscabiei]MDX3669997.1 hypothetical protein [Streptomyces europaeiscabiei]
MITMRRILGHRFYRCTPDAEREPDKRHFTGLAKREQVADARTESDSLRLVQMWKQSAILSSILGGAASGAARSTFTWLIGLLTDHQK